MSERKFKPVMYETAEEAEDGGYKAHITHVPGYLRYDIRKGVWCGDKDKWRPLEKCDRRSGVERRRE